MRKTLRAIVVIASLLFAQTAFADLLVPSGAFTVRQYQYPSTSFVYGYIFVGYTGEDDPVSAQVLLQDGAMIDCPSVYCTMAEYDGGIWRFIYNFPGFHFNGGVVWATITGVETTLTIHANCDALSGKYCNGPDL